MPKKDETGSNHIPASDSRRRHRGSFPLVRAVRGTRGILLSAVHAWVAAVRAAWAAASSWAAGACHAAACHAAASPVRARRAERRSRCNFSVR